ncbi:MAG: hypothetical protein R3E88_15780 [Myxococcota bacterium]
MSARTGARERAAFAALVALQLVPVWAFGPFATQDGATHLFNAVALAEWSDPARALLREVFAVSREPNPNWTAQLVLAALARALDPDVAERVLVSAYVVGLPLALHALLRALGHARPWLALAAVPLAHGFALGMGLYNFCLSVALWAWALALYVRAAERGGVARFAAFGAACVLLYFTHVVSTLALAVTIGALELAELARAPRAWRAQAARVGRAAVAALPCALLVLWFASSEGGPAGLVFAGRAVLVNVRNTFALVFFSAWGDQDVAPLAPMLFALALLATSLDRRGARHPAARGLGIAALALLALAVVMPSSSLAGEMLTPRLVLYPVLLAAAWIGARTPDADGAGGAGTGDAGRAGRAGDATGSAGPRPASLAGVALGLAALLAAAVAALDQRAASAELAAYHACDAAIPEGAVLLPLTFEPTARFAGVGSLYAPVDPFVHAGARSALRRGAVNLDNHTAENGNHPLVWRAGFVPVRTIGCVECMPPVDLDLEAYPRPVDAVLLWKAPASVPGALGRALARDYALACGAEPGARTQLWVRRARGAREPAAVPRAPEGGA